MVNLDCVFAVVYLLGLRFVGGWGLAGLLLVYWRFGFLFDLLWFLCGLGLMWVSGFLVGGFGVGLWCLVLTMGAGVFAWVVCFGYVVYSLMFVLFVPVVLVVSGWFGF